MQKGLSIFIIVISLVGFLYLNRSQVKIIAIHKDNYAPVVVVD